MTDLGALNYFLGISATRSSTSLFLSQKKYACELLGRANMVNCNPSRTPVDTDSKLDPEGVAVQDPTLYRSLAGGLQYLTFTRPDLSYIVQQICLYMHDPREPHFAALKRILRYVQGDNLLSWSSKRQHTISHSSAEAKYHGVANVVVETVWLHNLRRELHSPLSTATLTSHILVLHVPSRYQYADIFTKGSLGLKSHVEDDTASTNPDWCQLDDLIKMWILSSLSNRLKNLGCNVSDKNLVMYTVNGLDSRFATLVDIIRHHETLPSFETTRNMLLLKESSFKDNTRTSSTFDGSSSSPTALVTSTSSTPKGPHTTPLLAQLPSTQAQSITYQRQKDPHFDKIIELAPIRINRNLVRYAKRNDLSVLGGGWGGASPAAMATSWEETKN
nr:hypothetical protein [Tanacetum cinerariifolium]